MCYIYHSLHGDSYTCSQSLFTQTKAKTPKLLRWPSNIRPSLTPQMSMKQVVKNYWNRLQQIKKCYLISPTPDQIVCTDAEFLVSLGEKKLWRMSLDWNDKNFLSEQHNQILLSQPRVSVASSKLGHKTHCNSQTYQHCPNRYSHYNLQRSGHYF